MQHPFSPSYPACSNDIPASPHPSATHSTAAVAAANEQKSLRFLSLREVAKMLGVAPITVYRIVARREMAVYRFARRISFKESDVLEWIEKQKKEARFF